MTSAVVTGTFSYDYIMDFPGRFADRIMMDKIHKISLSFLVNKLTKQIGGTAGNIAYSLKLLGLEPEIVAPAGNDFDDYKSFLLKNKISIKDIVIHESTGTGAYFVVTDKDDNQIGSFFTGANVYADKLTLAKKRKPKNFVIIAPTIPKAMIKYVSECRKFKMPYLYDPAFQIGAFSAPELREGISSAAILIGNDYEISLIEDKLGISHEELRVMVPVLITTLASKGSIIETRHESIHIKPAKPKNTSDPTGAGDAYRAGFISGFLRNFDLVTCGQMGSVAAAYTVEKYGTVTHFYTRKEFAKRYKENFGASLML